MPEALEAVCPVSSLILLSPLAIVPPPAESLPGLNLADPDSTRDDTRPDRRSPAPGLSSTEVGATLDEIAIPSARAGLTSSALETPVEVAEDRFQVRSSLSVDSPGAASLFVLGSPPAYPGISPTTSQPQVERLTSAGAIRPLTLPPTYALNLGMTASTSTADALRTSTFLDISSTLQGSGFVPASAQTVLGGEEEDSGNPGNPTVTISGDNVVGGAASASVEAPGSAIIKKVTWSITGAVESQNYSNAEGKIVDFPSPKTVTVNDGSANIEFYWGATTGAQTVTATVTYAAPWSGGGSDSKNVTVIAPTVNRLVLDSYPLKWVDGLRTDPFGGTNQPGFILQGQDPDPEKSGFSLGASVTLPNTANESGNYGFIQRVSMDLTITNQGTGAHILNTGGLVLDNNPQFRLPHSQGWLGFSSWNSALLEPGDTVSNIEWEPGSPRDRPRLPVRNANVMGNPDPPIEMKIDVQFEDWLVYRSGSGIWVGIGKVGPLTISGHQSFDDATNTWVEVAAPTPAGLGVIVPGGAVGPQFVTWTGYLTSFDFTPPYPGPYFGL